MIFQRQNLLFTTLCLEINRFTRLCCAFRAIEAMAWQNDFYTLVISITFSVQIEFLECLDVLYQLSIVLNSSHFASFCPTYPYLTQFRSCQTNTVAPPCNITWPQKCFPIFSLRLEWLLIDRGQAKACSMVHIQQSVMLWHAMPLLVRLFSQRSETYINGWARLGSRPSYGSTTLNPKSLNHHFNKRFCTWFTHLKLSEMPRHSSSAWCKGHYNDFPNPRWQGRVEKHWKTMNHL